MIRSILTRSQSNQPSQSHKTIEVVADKGLIGDRYFHSGTPDDGATFIESEALVSLKDETGIELSHDATGRNFLTHGIDLNALVGTYFRCGSAVFYGSEPCDPCLTLERRTQSGVLKGLVNRGGLRARIVKSGAVSIGDDLTLLTDEH